MRRNIQGDGEHLIKELYADPTEDFYNYFRMSREQFQCLLEIVGPTITKMHWVREPISAQTRLAVTIRYLATGDSMKSLAFAYRCGKTTVHNIIRECLDALWMDLKEKVFVDPSEAFWKQIAKGYSDRWNFPNCVGSIDGKHIAIEAPAHGGSTYYNYKGHHSIILLATCTSDYKFTMVDIGAPGRLSDGGVFKNSELGHRLENKTLNLPEPSFLPHNGPLAPYVFVGDEAFQLTKYMMRPYPRRTVLNLEKRVFNYRLCRARRVIENRFGILVAKWRIFKQPLYASLETAESIVKAAVCLHNYMKDCEKHVPQQRRTYHPTHLTDVDDEENGVWRVEYPKNTMYPISNVGSNAHSVLASTVRDTYAKYFMEQGVVDWQWERVKNARY